MKIYVNVTFPGRPDLFVQLVETFFIREFNPKSSFLYDGNGKVRMIIEFENKPPVGIMSILFKGHIKSLDYKGNKIDDSWLNALLESTKGSQLTNNFGNEEKLEVTTQGQSDRAKLHEDDEESKTEGEEPSDDVSKGQSEGDDLSAGEDSTQSEGEEPSDDVSKAKSEDGDLPAEEGSTQSEGKESSDGVDVMQSVETEGSAKFPSSFLESAEALNLPERIREIYLRMLEVSMHIEGRVTWELIAEAGVKVSIRQKKKIVKAIKDVYGVSRTMTFVKNLVMAEKGKLAATELEGDEDKSASESSGDGSQPDTEGSSDERKVFTFTCVREQEFDSVLLHAYEVELNSISKDKPLIDRVKDVFETFDNAEVKASVDMEKIAEEGSALTLTTGQDFVTDVLRLHTISFDSPLLNERYEKYVLMKKRVDVLKLFKDKFKALGVPAEEVSLGEILCDLRKMIMSEEEIRALA